jgi:hypothetical protein
VSSLLSTVARLAVVPAAFTGPWAAVLVPTLLYIATKREVSVSVTLR